MNQTIELLLWMYCMWLYLIWS